MTDSDQPNSSRPEGNAPHARSKGAPPTRDGLPRFEAERFDLQLDEWLGTHLLGPEGSGYPADTDFERMARAIESAVLAHDAAAPMRTPMRGEGESGGSADGLAEAHPAAGHDDVDWCLAAPLPLRSGEPLNWGAEAGGTPLVGTPARDPAQQNLGSQGLGSQGLGSQGLGSQGRSRGEQTVRGASADEPSLRELAEAMLANGRQPERQERQAAERSGVDLAGVDRISEVKPLKGARPAAKPPQPPRVAGPIGVVHLARQNATDLRVVAHERGPNDDARAPASVEHRANAVSEAPRPRDEGTLRNGASARKLNWLWGAMAIAAAIALGVQFGKHSGNSVAQDDGAKGDAVAQDQAVALGNTEALNHAAASQGLVSGQTAQPALLAPGSRAAEEALKADGEAVAVADLAALPHDSETPELARPHAARSTAGSAEPGAASRQAAGSNAGRAKPGEPGLEAPPSAESPSAGALASRDEAPGSKTSPAEGAGSESEPALRPAARTSGLPPEPSAGAATGAIGVVLPGARACVAGQFEPSRANVVFGSDGRVVRVEVSGPAAGTPAEACISRVLKAARVGAFSSESFSVRTTVRP